MHVDKAHFIAPRPLHADCCGGPPDAPQTRTFRLSLIQWHCTETCNKAGKDALAHDGIYLEIHGDLSKTIYLVDIFTETFKANL